MATKERAVLKASRLGLCHRYWLGFTPSYFFPSIRAVVHQHLMTPIVTDHHLYEIWFLLVGIQLEYALLKFECPV